MAKNATAKKGSASKEEIEAALKAKEGNPFPYSIKSTKA
jgi:hypothetical protein